MPTKLSKNVEFQAALALVKAAPSWSAKLRAAGADRLYLYTDTDDLRRRIFGTLTTMILDDMLEGNDRAAEFVPAITKGLQGVRSRALDLVEASIGNPALGAALSAVADVDAAAGELLMQWVTGAGEQLEKRQLDRAIDLGKQNLIKNVVLIGVAIIGANWLLNRITR